ncbi:trimeric intracellular cation channel family protein [Sandarakinorhabdus sp. DWP1-3-1]|uniref:trimeric intracellular cation channel family protein n=1 Tax=Sandarakinorhabdus sp. DWP1-3-1 TaxID=2804627 RepID=UPI003CF86E1E
MRIRDHLLTAVDLAATFLLAIECAIVGIHAGLDLFGLLVLAFVGSVGGGVMRDLLLGEHPPSAFRDWRYAALALLATAGTAVVTFAFGPVGGLTPPLTLDVFAAVGLALAALAGTQKALDCGISSTGAIIIATVNGCGGGILRDILTAQVPHVLRADFYATAALAGAALIVVLVRRFGVARGRAVLAGGLVIFALRTAALVGDWSLPHLR